MSGVLALTWFEHRRTTELCAGLNVELDILTTQLRGPLRYLVLGFRTLALLVRRRPAVLLVQNPSLILAAFALLLRRLLRYRLLVDAHNEAVQPFKNRQRWIAQLSKWVIRGADLTIVTNRYLAEQVAMLGGRAFTLPDRVPSPPAAPMRELSHSFNVVLVATFDSDEPYAEVFSAVDGVDVQLYVTGNQRRLDPAVASAAPSNVKFTGFLAEDAYWSLLRGADAIIDLTLKDNCLVCGSYEALALAKPMLLSDNAAGRELFGTSAVFTDNSSADIRRALARLRAERASLEAAAERKRAELSVLWDNARRTLSAAIAKLSVNSSVSDRGLLD